MSTPPNTSGANNRNNNNNNSYRRGGGRRQGGRGRGGRHNNRRDRIKNNPKNSGFQGALKEGPLKGIVITDNSGSRATQFQKMKEAIPTYCADKGWRGLPQIIRSETVGTCILSLLLDQIQINGQGQ